MLTINTRNYKKLEYLVAGTGRCGTVFFAQLLTNMGIPCGHEHIFNLQDKKLCFERLIDPLKRINSLCSETSFLSKDYENKFVDVTKTIAESSYFLVPYLNENYLKGIPLLHVTRHPFKVIRSFVEDFNYFKNPEDYDDIYIKKYENFLYKNYPELLLYSNPYDRAAQYYISCNEKLFEQKSKRSYLLIKIEDVKNNKKIIEKFFKKRFPKELPIHRNSRIKCEIKEIDFNCFENDELKIKLKSIMEFLKYSDQPNFSQDT